MRAGGYDQYAPPSLRWSQRRDATARELERDPLARLRRERRRASSSTERRRPA